MVQNRQRSRLLVSLIVLLSLTAACGRKSPGGTTLPSAGPYIIESVTCLGVENGYPWGVTDEFYPGDTVYLWTLWGDIPETLTVTSRWVSPAGGFDTTSVLLPPGDRRVTLFFYPLGLAPDEGTWEVQLYVAGEFRRSQFFQVISSGVSSPQVVEP